MWLKFQCQWQSITIVSRHPKEANQAIHGHEHQRSFPLTTLIPPITRVVADEADDTTCSAAEAAGIEPRILKNIRFSKGQQKQKGLRHHLAAWFLGFRPVIEVPRRWIVSSSQEAQLSGVCSEQVQTS